MSRLSCVKLLRGRGFRLSSPATLYGESDIYCVAFWGANPFHMSAIGCEGSTDSAFAKRLAILAFILPAVGCAGSKSTSTQPPSSSSTQQVTIKLNLSSVTLAAGAQQQFTASIQGTTNTAVTWSVDSVAGGSTAAGTITSAGMYTAPAQAGTHTVTATSVANTADSASAAVTVTAPASSLPISPAAAGVTPGETQQFNATMPGQSNPTVTWSVDGVNGGNSTVGTISGKGLYTAPSQIGSHNITAAVGSPSASANAAVTVFDFSISTIANGRVFVSTATELDIYGLLAQ